MISDVAINQIKLFSKTMINHAMNERFERSFSPVEQYQPGGHTT